MQNNMVPNNHINSVAPSSTVSTKKESEAPNYGNIKLVPMLEGKASEVILDSQTKVERRKEQPELNSS